MAGDPSQYDPMEFLRSVWGQMPFPVPGFVTPTLDVDELDKRITDMRAVEGWLKMNLNMLQMSIQGLEMQRAALAAFDKFGNRGDHPRGDRRGGGGAIGYLVLERAGDRAIAAHVDIDQFVLRPAFAHLALPFRAPHPKCAAP